MPRRRSRSRSHSRSKSLRRSSRSKSHRYTSLKPGVGGHCPPGMLMRKAYNARRRSRSGSRSRSYRVKARCVRGSGADPSHHVPKRDRVIPKLKKGTLRSQGYDTKESASDRHAALRRAVRKYGYRTVMGKVNAVYVLNRNKPVGRVFESDKTWLKETYGSS